MIELRLETGERLDLRGDEIIALTYAVNDIGSIETRQGVSSNQFDLPITDFNLKSLGYPTLFNINQNVNPFKKISASIFEDELRIAKGHIQIGEPSISKGIIPVTFFGENAEWFNSIKGKSIRELDLSEFSHVLQPSDIQESFGNTEGYKYSLIDRNGLNFVIGNNIPCQAFTISTYQSTIVKAIIESIDFKIDGTLLNDALYKNTLIPDTNNKFYALDQNVARTTSLGTIDTTYTSATETTILFTPTPNFNAVGDNYNESTGVYTFDTGYYAGASISLLMENIGASNTDITVRAYINGVVVDSVVSSAVPPGNKPLININLGDTFINGGAFRLFESGDTLSFTVESSAEDVTILASQVTDVGGLLGVFVTGSFGVFAFNIAIEGFGVDISPSLPDIDQSDFLKEVVFDHNAIVTVNLSSKTISLNLKNYSYNNFIDWSNKLDLSQDVSINYDGLVSSYSNINDVKRAETDGAFIKEYNSKSLVKFGNGRFDIQNDFIDKRKSIFESKFGATYTITSLNESMAMPYIIGEKVSEVCDVLLFGPSFIRVSVDYDLEDFTDIVGNSVWAFVTDSTNFDSAYAVSVVTRDVSNTYYTIFTNGNFPATEAATIRLVVRDEEAVPRKLIDAGNFDIENINTSNTSLNIVSTLPATENIVNITQIPYFYFWNPIKNNPTDNTNLSLSYGVIDIPSLNVPLFDEYYPDTIKILQDGKMLKASFRLNQIDIFNLDFNKLIYVNFTLNGQTINGYFILNKISEYSGQDDSTVCELIKY